MLYADNRINDYRFFYFIHIEAGVEKMKINEGQRIGSVNPYKKTTDVANTGAAEKKNKPKDQVQISSEAMELLGAQGTVRTEEHIQRLNELRESVSAGTYHVDAKKIAEKLFPFIK
jgi:negative regulator of flagellin synthesis FlgM